MLKITTAHSGKMTNMVSINNSSRNNTYCQAMAATDAVCNVCYSERTLKIRKTMNEAYIRNGELLSSDIIPSEELPRINAHTIRFNAFGELHNITHLINYFNICKANPRAVFTLWTKRKDLVFKAVRDFGKPENLILVYSSPELNTPERLPQHFDKVFTVFTKDQARYDANFNDYAINCGEKKCFDCLTCYDPNNKTVYINELKK